MKTARLIAAFCLIAAPAAAMAEATLSIPLTLGPDSQILTSRYSCAGGDPFTVQYVNTDANTLALIPIDGAGRVFVNVVSGSGSRYVSGSHEWWVKGDDATLTDQLQDGSAQDCTTVSE
ncbi:hypothetical protein OCGS_0455 [Oceaniovalibus guishaninsula JLT2003]|uniref:C-type lysozyme inhibitor domain-containing protein n=1 Tax=Oceaniovalibus guishaninsula JLT2003 TaxID=1231392 RepID=K2I8I8_9RHOB|nr:MliC family protein [Oceaniovalibus guishaninsula]EKE45365.1 hypothetical protein OCGS_0455 [Oceaniovalibus guishaninsula JLT2003]